jgi:hypothetical protein
MVDRLLRQFVQILIHYRIMNCCDEAFREVEGFYEISSNTLRYSNDSIRPLIEATSH